MPARALSRRLDHVESSQGVSSGQVGRIVFVTPSEWPTFVQNVYAKAKATGDLAAQADIVEQRTGIRPVFSTSSRRSTSLAAPAIIEICVRPDGPQ